MYKRTEIGSCIVPIFERECIYRYFLIETCKNINATEKFINLPCYGISIVKEEYKDGKLIDSYEDSIDSMTPVLSKALNLINYLKDNEVSPLHLIDIAGWYADDWVSDFEIEVCKIGDSDMAVI